MGGKQGRSERQKNGEGGRKEVWVMKGKKIIKAKVTEKEEEEGEEEEGEEGGGRRRRVRRVRREGV